MYCTAMYVCIFSSLTHLPAEALFSPFLFICTSFVVGWVPVVSALSVTAVDGGKEQEGLVEREKQRWALASNTDFVSKRF